MMSTPNDFSNSGMVAHDPSLYPNAIMRWLRKVRTTDRYGGSSLVFRHIDARGLVVGRLATVLSVLLMGKHKPNFTPSADNGDVVIVTNADKVNFTGKKWSQKVYRHHTGWPGGLREVVAEKQWQVRKTDYVQLSCLMFL